MNENLLFLPVVTQVALTFCLYIYLGMAKSKAEKLGLVNQERRALHHDSWPDNVIQINNCIRNQFEVPVLFYVLTIILWLTNTVNIYIYVLAWAFVASRLLHAFIHVGSNYVPLRRKVFMFGCVLLMVLTLMLGWSIVMAPNV